MCDQKIVAIDANIDICPAPAQMMREFLKRKIDYLSRLVKINSQLQQYDKVDFQSECVIRLQIILLNVRNSSFSS